MNTTAGIVFAAALAAAAGTRAAEAAPAPAASPEALQAEIAAMKPPKHPWRAIGWKNCPLEALKEAREKHRPVLVWVFLGNPTDERC